MATQMSVTDLLLFCQECAENDKAQTNLFEFVNASGNVTETLTYAELWQQSGAIASALLQQFQAGDKLFLLYTPGLEFVLAFMACLRAELIAVPIPPLDLNENGLRAQEENRKLDAIVKASGVVGILTNTEYYQVCSLISVKNWIKSWIWTDIISIQWPDLRWVVTTRLRYGSTTLPKQTVPTPPDRIAYMQFSSGSTSHPKGIRITFGNISHQLAASVAVLDLSSSSCTVCWMPQFHDWCLISHICNALSGNGRLILMSPLSFLSRPILWLELIMRYSAAHMVCPPFALGLLIRKTTPEQRRQLRLESIRTLLLGATVIKADVISKFCDAFAEAGIRHDMIRTAYGLAEHTAGVTMTAANDVVVLGVNKDVLFHENRVEFQDDSPYTIVSCGRPMPGVTIRIVNEGRVQADGMIGEIWVDSDSKAAGYEGVNDNLNESIFSCELEGDHQTYLRTGDLGYLYDGQLYLTGRIKEVLRFATNASTLYPEDLEICAAQASDLIRPGSVCAFSYQHQQDGGDRLVILAEIVKGACPSPDALQDAVVAIREAILATFLVYSQVIILGRPGQLILKTTSGKIQRAKLRKQYVEGKLNADLTTSNNTPVSKSLLHVSIMESPLTSPTGVVLSNKKF